MNYQTPNRIGLPAKSIKAGGETYSPYEVRAILKKLADLGINQDKIIAQITPHEAAVLKSLGGSGRVNPRTGLLSFDDGGGGGDGGGGDGGGGDGGGGEGGGGEGGGGEGGGGEAGGGEGAGGEAGGAGDAGGEGAGSNDGGSGSASAGEGAGADEGGGGFGGFGGGWGGYGDTGDAAGYSGPAGDAMGEAAAGYGFGNTGTTGDAPSGDPMGGDPNPDLFAPEANPMAGTLADAISGMMQGVSRSDAELIANIIQESMLQGTPLSLAEAAQQAGVLGQGSPSQDTSAYGSLGTGPAAAGYAGSFTTGSGVSGQGVGALGETSYGGFGLSGPQGQSSEYGSLGNVSGLSQGAFGTLGEGPGAAGYASAWNSDTGVSGQGVGALGETGAGQFGLSGVQGVSPDYGGLTAAGLAGLVSGPTTGSFPAGDIAGTTGLLSMGTEPGLVQGTAPTVSDIFGPPVFAPQGETSPVVTAPELTIRGEKTTPSVVIPDEQAVSPVVPTAPVVKDEPVVTEPGATGPTAEELLTGGGDEWVRPTALVEDVVAPKTTTPTASTSTGTKPVIPPEQARAIVEAIIGRRRTPYLTDYYKNYNPEGLKFAMGGPVVQSSFPVTAYTDGQGPVGAIAAPPALTGYQAAGYDNVVGSPMAPAPAAAAPSLFGGGPLSAARNTNAMPVQSQISQNPNVASSLGYGPLARLT
jgi:hypothetical protein